MCEHNNFGKQFIEFPVQLIKIYESNKAKQLRDNIDGISSDVLSCLVYDNKSIGNYLGRKGRSSPSVIFESSSVNLHGFCYPRDSHRCI